MLKKLFEKYEYCIKFWLCYFIRDCECAIFKLLNLFLGEIWRLLI